MKQIDSLWQEVRDLSLGNATAVRRLDSPPAPLEFLRDFVSLNKPCLISGAATAHWPAAALWRDRAHLTRALSSSSVTVHLTPNGRADSLIPIDGGSASSSPPPPPALCFASAHAQRVPFAEALDMISRSSRESNFVAYAQQQNDCFRSEYGPLARDCDGHVPWASEALGSLPEAVNLWIGNHFSETSFHKDHYENLYAVVTGEKHFLLLPPTDVHRMYIKDYPAAQYSYIKETGEFKLEVEEPIKYVPWCSVDPYPSPENLESEMAKFPLYFNGPKPFECTVKAGEILYLPSMWFHYVKQTPDDTGLTIAVNYWYDMQFDMKYAYFNFLQSIEYQPIHDYTGTEEESEDL